MSVTETLKQIYSGSFSRYISLSEKLEDLIHQQSKLVNSLIKLHINLLQIWQKYKKPLHVQQEDIFTEPITKQIELIKNFTAENRAENEYLHYISDFIDVFRWMKQPQMEIFFDDIDNKIILYKHQLRKGSLCSDSVHSDWLEAWIESLEEFSRFILTFFKNGPCWTGSEKLPAHIVLGDIAMEHRNFDHSALFREINQGENITRILRHIDEESTGVSSNSEE